MKETESDCCQHVYHDRENMPGIKTVFFKFEEDFAQDNVRCIPMIVRFKLDACGIKLKLNEWSRMTTEERKLLSQMECSDVRDILHYRTYLQQLTLKRAGTEAAELPVELNPGWADIDNIPCILAELLRAFKWHISLRQWQDLTNLQRFVLLKLCRPGHEHKNFPIAIKEFGLV